MNVQFQVLETVLAFALVVVLAHLLKRLGVVKEEDGPTFARLLTQGILPVAIFHQLLTLPISLRQFVPVAIMALCGVASLGVAWCAGWLLRFDRPTVGALMLTSAFGSSALVGYPLIQFAFPNDPHALADAVLISELGVGLPLFILAPLVAMHFGAQAGKAPAISVTLLGYLRSPIFIAVALGLLLAQARLPLDGPFLAPFMEALRMIEGALTVVACLILGIQLSLGSLGGAWLLVAVAAGINMLFQPWLAGLLGTLTDIGDEQRQILVLISAMPSAVLGPVFATRYDCAPKKATAIVFANVLLSLVAVPAVFSALVR